MGRTQVIEARLERQATQPIGLAEELLSRGIRPGGRVLELEEIRAPEIVSNDLRLGSRAKVVRLGTCMARKCTYLGSPTKVGLWALSR